MIRAAQPSLSVEGQQALDLYAYALKRVEDLSPVTICNYLSDLRQFIASGWCEKQDESSFTPQAVIPSLSNLATTLVSSTCKNDCNKTGSVLLLFQPEKPHDSLQHPGFVAMRTAH